jgi:sterol desaturase/sphingolipid hydroxylase (fatty acid hydroxylase superfamily)
MLSSTIFLATLFAILLGIEIGYDRYRELGIYGLWDTVNNLSAGLIGTLLGYIFGIFTVPFFLWLYDIAPFKFSPENWWSWLVLFLLDDLTDYWIHRSCHERRFLWNFHMVHHSSENFNLSVALRQTWFGNILHWLTYAPLALLGFPLWMYLAVHGLNLAYQAWIHTRFIGRLGWLEYVFNTPSHHRAHHGVNDIYLDKNYGGVLIVWDRIFGSFVPETETPRYGLIHPVKSSNSIWINVHGWAEMLAAVKTRRSVYGKLKCIFGPPDML